MEGVLLSNNKIETIENDTLKDLTQLKFLSLHTNNIQSLPAHLFTGTDFIFELNFRDPYATTAIRLARTKKLSGPRIRAFRTFIII